MEEDFVKFWRYKLPIDFMEKDLNTVAAEVLLDCKGGKNYGGLDPKKGVCRAGVWKLKKQLGPTKINPERRKALIKECIRFAKKASPRGSNNGKINIANSTIFK